MIYPGGGCIDKAKLQRAVEYNAVQSNTIQYSTLVSSNPSSCSVNTVQYSVVSSLPSDAFLRLLYGFRCRSA